MKKYYRLISRMLFAIGLGLMFISSQSFAQSTSVSGTIKDTESGDPIPGVNVVVKGTSNGTVTDVDGNYTISVDKDAVLVYSFVGYATQEVTVGSQTTINLSMEMDISQLGEVVVIGYGEIKKDDATGSVLAIGKDDFNPGAVGSPQELLLGKAAGVVITSAGGAAGAGQTIRIRGGSSLRANNDPLIVIDGIPLESAGISGMANPLSTINPNDIETFTVLKDASATAIYGSRASNGVIIITTKQGSKDGKMLVSYNGNVQVGVANKKLEVFSGDEYRNLVQDRVDNYGFDAAALNGLGTANTDWQNEIYRNAISTDHNVALSGAIKSTPFRVSVGYTSQDGILKE
ncbi:Outer membrane TonB-dependent transporter, utilization system for glycans and polysaccharides (PUL), SusC family, partial [hydrothermal vent metagenome]